MATLSLAFLRPPSDEDRWLNKLTAKVSRHGVCHVEMIFEGNLAFSIYDDSIGPFLRQRTMSNPHYEFVSLSVSHKEYRAALQFCRSVVAEGYAFDNRGMYLASVHPGHCAERSSSAVGRTFCSKIITEALQFADVQEVEGLCPSAVTPSSLFGTVKDSSRRICHTARPSPDQTAAASKPMMTMPLRLFQGGICKTMVSPPGAGVG